MSSNPIHCELYSIQYYACLSVTCDRSVFSSTNKTDRHDITEILLKVSLNTINQTYIYIFFFFGYRYYSRSSIGRMGDWQCMSDICWRIVWQQRKLFVIQPWADGNGNNDLVVNSFFDVGSILYDCYLIPRLYWNKTIIWFIQKINISVLLFQA